MENHEKPSSSVYNSKNDNSKKYKFYKKPPIKKIGPEVKQTKTSLARLFKSNPLLKYDFNVNGDRLKKLSLHSKSADTEIAKISLDYLYGNGPYIKTKINHLIRGRVSSSDFNKDILSSTLIEDEDVFKIPSSSKYMKLQSRENGVGNEKQKNGVVHKNSTKTLSSQHFGLKKIERNEKTRTGSKTLRRSLSADNFPNKCYTIEEDEDNEHSQLHPTEYHSMDDLSKTNKETNADAPGSTHPTSAHSNEELQKGLDKLITEYKRNSLSNHDANYDEENKENIETEIPESDSYEDLKIKISTICNLKNSNSDLQAYSETNNISAGNN